MGETKSPDFSQGLEQLARLGLPSMKGAEWVEFSGESDQGFTRSYEFRELGVNLTGSAWKLATEPPTYVEFGSAQALASPDSAGDGEEGDSRKKTGLLGKMLRNYRQENPEPGKPEKTAPVISRAAKDAERIATSLAKESVAEEVNDNIRWGNSALHGRLMLFAAQLHAAGETESADKLASALFNAVENDPALVDGAISHLADNQYSEVAGAFFKNTDWEIYLSAANALLEKFPRGWANAPAVALLVSKLEKRLDTPPPPSLPGIELKPEALQLLGSLLEKQEAVTDLDALAAAQGININDYPVEMRPQIIAMLQERGMGGSEQGLWLLPSAGESTAADTSPTGKLKAMGMDGFIALAAVATDETLVPARHTGDQGSYHGSNESPAEEIRQRYQHLTRPTSRGEIAVALISSVLPVQDDDEFGNSSQPDPAELSEAAIAFWKSNRDKSPVELASLYIAEGNSTQQSYASTFLASGKDPAAHAAFEKSVLASDDPIALAANVEEYLDARKKAAKPFADAYIRLLRENPPSDEDLQRTTGGYQIREAGGLENFIKKLSLKVGDVSLAKMVADALKAPGETEPSPLAALASAIQSIPLNECLVAFGKVAGAASADQWMEIHNLLRTRIYYELRNSDDDDPGGFEPLPENVLEIWRPLAARAEPLPSEGDFPQYASAYGAKTTGDASALILELATSPGLAYAVNNFAQIEGRSDVVMEHVRKRVDAWSSGKEPEPWPDAENVSEERTEEISAKLSELKAGEIIPYATYLNRDERLALMGVLSEYGDSNPAPPGLLELRETVVSLQPVFGQYHDAKATAKLGISVGDQITAELLTRISDSLLADPAATSTTTVALFPAAMNLGSNLLVTTAKDLDPAKSRSSGLANVASLFEQFENPDAISTIVVGQNGDVRVMKEGKPVTLESEGSGLEDLAKALESKSAVLPAIRIYILTKEDAEKISNQE